MQALLGIHKSVEMGAWWARIISFTELHHIMICTRLALHPLSFVGKLIHYHQPIITLPLVNPASGKLERW